MKTKKISKKNEENLINEVVKRYKICLCRAIKNGTSVKQDGMLFDPTAGYKTFWKISAGEELSDDEREICRINFILSSMVKREMEIIWNEFFFVEDKFWWMRKYNRSTYYRIRSKAISSFCALI